MVDLSNPFLSGKTMGHIQNWDGTVIEMWSELGQQPKLLILADTSRQVFLRDLDKQKQGKKHLMMQPSIWWEPRSHWFLLNQNQETLGFKQKNDLTHSNWIKKKCTLCGSPRWLDGKSQLCGEVAENWFLSTAVFDYCFCHQCSLNWIGWGKNSRNKKDTSNLRLQVLHVYLYI